MFVACVLTKKDMQYYSKINTCFKRVQDPQSPLRNCIIPEEFSQEEFSILANCKWLATEKIDGTNMSYHFKYVDTPLGAEDCLEVKGKTPEASIPTPLIEKMQSMLTKDDFYRVFVKDETDLVDVFIFGEGYGKKIMKHGSDYIKDGVGFIVFDIKINGIWLTRESVEDICKQLNLDVVPLVGYMRLFEAIEYVAKGFKSAVAENKDLNAEGLVLTAPLGMLDRLGNRIITKIKTCDFTKLNAKLKSIK